MDLRVSTNTAVRYVQILGTGILLVIFLTSTHIDSTEARSITSEDEYFVEPLVKRNTWWTKKSLNAMDTVPHSNYETNDGSFEKCQDTVEIYSCYVTKCVQTFVKCARQADTDELFGACKMLHKLCATSCSKTLNTDDFMML